MRCPKKPNIAICFRYIYIILRLRMHNYTCLESINFQPLNLRMIVCHLCPPCSCSLQESLLSRCPLLSCCTRMRWNHPLKKQQRNLIKWERDSLMSLEWFMTYLYIHSKTCDIILSLVLTAQTQWNLAWRSHLIWALETVTPPHWLEPLERGKTLVLFYLLSQKKIF